MSEAHHRPGAHHPSAGSPLQVFGIAGLKTVYVDMSWIIAIAFDERGAKTQAGRFKTFERRVSSGLLEAELQSAFARERQAGPAESFA